MDTHPTLHLPDPDATHALGAALGRAAFPGAVLALQGDLGAGKTLLTQGLAAALGVSGPVQSPTFLLLAEHDSGRLPLFHADLYRLDDPADLVQTGLDDVIGVIGVTVVEWADKHPEALPDERLELTLAHAPDGRGRVATWRAFGARHVAWGAALRG
ncbi:MAG: tRNA (adenosine(37)-N6)-threonylcarbamoyltransferase complex ATPase subunit type 1 TsaE [Alphaproteobacteria bacterium]|nr:tRNA (adenosine(37)-N6)-threonylcarbamoyltransferase complex ATPase subunit type 1 TsaE [Alphaproteobacteria bacterium]